MSEVHLHRVQPAWKKRALIDNETYLKWYRDSVRNPDKFWAKHGRRIDWFKPFTKVKSCPTCFVCGSSVYRQQSSWRHSRRVTRSRLRSLR